MSLDDLRKFLGMPTKAEAAQQELIDDTNVALNTAIWNHDGDAVLQAAIAAMQNPTLPIETRQGEAERARNAAAWKKGLFSPLTTQIADYCNKLNGS